MTPASSTHPRRERLRRIAGIVFLVLCVVFLLAGGRRKMRAYEQTTDEFGILTFNTISEAALVEDSTFAGVIRKDGRLYSTYDRSAPKEGKRACPT